MPFDSAVGWMQWWDGLTGLPCHQLAARSPSHDGHPFALCWRCSGIYLGIAASALWVMGRTRGRARPPSNRSALGCALLMLPLMVDGWGQALGIWQTEDHLRFATGWAMGIGLPPLCLPLLATARGTDRRSIGEGPEWLLLASGGLVAWSLLRIPSEPMAMLLRLFANLGQLFLLISLVAAVVIHLLRRPLPRG